MLFFFHAKPEKSVIFLFDCASRKIYVGSKFNHFYYFEKAVIEFGHSWTIYNIMCIFFSNCEIGIQGDI